MLVFKILGLPNLSILALLTFLIENVGSSLVIGPSNDPIVSYQIPDLDHNTALDLCRKMNETRIPHTHRYLWAFIHPDKKSVNSLEKSDASTTENHLTVSPACTVYKWRHCDGKTRFPLVDECGFFDIIPQSPENCGKIGSYGTVAQNPITAGKHDGQPILMSHGQAADLCLVVNRMPTNADETAQVKLTPIRLELDARAQNHLSKDCVFWKYVPCANGETDVGATNGCGKWHSAISEQQACELYRAYVENNLQIPEYGNFSQVVEDFFQSPPEHNKLPNTNEGDVDELSADSMEIDSVSDLIHCQRLGSSVSCSILPRSSMRIKREERPLVVKRNKRQCCTIESCFECPGYHGQYSWLRSDLHAFRDFDCNCQCLRGNCIHLRLNPKRCVDCIDLRGRSF